MDAGPSAGISQGRALPGRQGAYSSSCDPEGLWAEAGSNEVSFAFRDPSGWSEGSRPEGSGRSQAGVMEAESLVAAGGVSRVW